MKYHVSITRIGYRQKDVEIEADTPQEAITRAEDLAGSLDFPPEHAYDYETGPAEEISDEGAKVGQAELDRLIGLTIELGLPEDALDDAVYDCTQDQTLGELNATDDKDKQEHIIGSSEERASNVNSGGIESQIEYLLQHNDAATVVQLIRESAA
jgi:hypothetical protein